MDVTAANSGSSTSSSSGSATTTNATDLIFGANIVFTTTSGAGSGFTKRLLTSPDGDIAEDRMVTATGSYSATAPIVPSGRWIMQMVAFRTGPNFTISASPSSLSIAQGNLGTSTITTTVSGGFSSAISLSATGVPDGHDGELQPEHDSGSGCGQLDHDHYGGGEYAGGNLSHHGDRQWRGYSAKHDGHANRDCTAQFHDFGLAVFSHHRARQSGDFYDHHHHQRWFQ